MKTATLVLACILATWTGPAALAQETPALGKSHYSFELGPMFIQHRDFTTDDGGFYVGLAGYGHLGDDWYLGGEVGGGGGFGLLFFDSSSFTPIELNAKRAFPLSRHWAMDIGGGLSYSRVEFTKNNWFSEDVTIDDWVFGGQLLAGIFFKAGWAHLGLKIKYQLTADVKGAAELVDSTQGWDYSNLKISLQLGFGIYD